MADYPSLSYIPLELLLAVGDPWQVDETLQGGDPGQITELAAAFSDATACTEETWNEFAAARERFREAWNREQGEHPIDDSAEVRRALTRLFVQREQLPAIAVHLQNLATELAVAEQKSTSAVDDMEAKLRLLDALVGEAVANAEDYCNIFDEAEEVTRLALEQIERIQDGYTDKLEAAAINLRVELGYDPSVIEDVDGDGEISPEQRGRTALDHYDANQRAKDEALLSTGGPLTPEKAAAEARLSDAETARDPAAGREERDLAAQRLDDFRMANFVGPIPKDPLLGGDARVRAQSRLEMQRQYEQGIYGLPRMSPDKATLLINDGESRARVNLLQESYEVLIAEGATEQGARRFLEQVSEGLPWNDLAQYNIDLANAAADGVSGYASSLPVNAHDIDKMTPADVHAIAEFAKYTGRAATLLDAITTYQQIKNGSPVGETAGEFVGGTALGSLGAWGAATGVAMFAPPGWVFVAAVVAGVSLGELGKWAGGKVGSSFD